MKRKLKFKLRHLFLAQLVLAASLVLAGRYEFGNESYWFPMFPEFLNVSQAKISRQQDGLILEGLSYDNHEFRYKLWN